MKMFDPNWLISVAHVGPKYLHPGALMKIPMKISRLTDNEMRDRLQRAHCTTNKLLKYQNCNKKDY